MKQYQYENYGQYVNMQVAATRKKKNVVWATKDNIDIIAEYIQHWMTPTHAICHGARTGKEIGYFQKHFRKCRIYGTDIFPIGKAKKYVIAWDMHDIKRAWLDLFDFIYSNSWDHFYDPEYGLKNWARTCKVDGFIILEDSDKHMEKGVTKFDPFGLEYGEVIPWVTSVLGDNFCFEVELKLNQSERRTHQRAMIWRRTK